MIWLRVWATHHKKLWLISVVFVALFAWCLAQELTLRKILREGGNTNKYTFWEEYKPHTTLFWRLRPFLHGKFVISDYALDEPDSSKKDTYMVTTNSLGMRNPETNFERDSDVFRVLCLGDELTFGYGVDDEYAYPSVLQHLLADKYRDNKFQVLNAGCPGWSSYQCREWVRLFGESFVPDVYIVGCGQTDIALENVLDSDRVSSFKIVRWISALLSNSELYLYYWHLNDKAINPYGLPPTGYKRYVSRVSKREFRENLQWIVDIAEANNAKVILVELPCSRSVDMEAFKSYNSIIKTVATKNSLYVADVQTLLNTKKTDDVFVKNRYLTINGYRLMASSIFSVLENIKKDGGKRE